MNKHRKKLIHLNNKQWKEQESLDKNDSVSVINLFYFIMTVRLQRSETN